MTAFKHTRIHTAEWRCNYRGCGDNLSPISPFPWSCGNDPTHLWLSILSRNLIPYSTLSFLGAMGSGDVTRPQRPNSSHLYLQSSIRYLGIPMISWGCEGLSSQQLPGPLNISSDPKCTRQNPEMGLAHPHLPPQILLISNSWVINQQHNILIKYGKIT